jgi:hypothetical protein
MAENAGFVAVQGSNIFACAHHGLYHWPDWSRKRAIVNPVGDPMANSCHQSLYFAHILRFPKTLQNYLALLEQQQFYRHFL